MLAKSIEVIENFVYHYRLCYFFWSWLYGSKEMRSRGMMV